MNEQEVYHSTPIKQPRTVLFSNTSELGMDRRRPNQKARRVLIQLTGFLRLHHSSSLPSGVGQSYYARYIPMYPDTVK